ncbi:unnamed protein product [Blepharisma stoltei]|uniref:Uncharacterized protein n=1 Tax=Blepharisma stoltei TaxID=1481888 RepID=A0AAU9K9T6_9CILI|nr:unnamed protein product [Blepharisma stoltei]
MDKASKTRSRFYITLPSLLRSTTTRQISASVVFPLTAVRKKSSDSLSPSPKNGLSYDSEDEERAAVEKLDFQEKEGQLEFIRSLKEAQSTLQKRVAGQDLVEGHILERKYRNRLPTLVKKITSVELQKHTTKQRMARKHEDEGFKDKCRYLKLYEDELEKAYEKLLNELKDVHKKREELRRECLDIKKQSVIFAGEIDKIKSQIAIQETKEVKKKKRSPEEFSEWMSYKAKLKELLSKRQEEAAKVNSSIGEEISKRAEPLQLLDSQSTQLRKQMGMVRDAQISHYLSLLKEGKDTRSEGLVWIVRSLWKLNQPVSPEMFPSFLDTDAIHSILFLAQKSVEIEQLSEELARISKLGSMNFSGNDKWNNIHARLFQLTKNIQTQKPKNVWDKVTKQMVVVYEDDTQANEDGPSKVVSISENKINDQHLQSLREVVKKAKELELQRLAQECLLSSYETKYNITLKELLSAIVGVESLDRYMAAISKEQKQLKDRLESTKTFSFARN